MSRQRVHFPLFDGLRATAALLVFVDHAWFRWHPAQCGFVACPSVGMSPGEIWRTVAPALGPAGVSVFFVISGFLLYRPFVAARVEGRSVMLGSYGLRRAARILPAYWLVLAVVLLFGAEERARSFGEVVQIFSLTSIYSYKGLLYNPVPPGWSVCVELSFYLFLPLWAVLVGRIVSSRRSPVRVEVVLLFALAVTAFVWRHAVVSHPPSGVGFQRLLGFLPSTDRILFGGFDLFAAGMLLALLSAHGVRFQLGRLGGSTCWASALVLLAGGAFLTASDGPFGDSPHVLALVGGFTRLAVALLIVLPAVAAVAGGLRAGADPVNRFLGLRSVVWIGVVSYGVYLWHSPVLAWIHELHAEVGSGYGWIVITLIGLGATVAVASASWIWLERPINRIAHRPPPEG